MFDFKAVLLLTFLSLFLVVALWPASGLTSSQLVDEEPVAYELSKIKTVKISASSLVLRLTEDVEKVYLVPSFLVKRADTTLTISGSAGTVVVGGKNLNVDVSSTFAEISGIFRKESLTVSSTVVEFRDLLVNSGGKISVSATVVVGKISVVGLKQELVITISANLHDLTVIVDRDSKEFVRFVGVVPKLVVTD